MLSFGAFGQDMELANEYLKKGDYEKAFTIYEKLAKDKNNINTIHSNYVLCMTKIKLWADAEKFLKRQIKTNDGSPAYRADLANVYEQQGKLDEAEKMYDDAIDNAQKNESSIYVLVDRFYTNARTDLMVKLLTKARVSAGNENKYAYLLWRAYQLEGKKELMIEEVLKYGLYESNAESAKSVLQDYLKDEKDIYLLEKTLYQKIQKFPNEVYYTEMLIWNLVQQQEFNKAFIQARALDRRLKQEGSKIFDLASIALKSKDFKTTISMYEYITTEYPQGEFYPHARRLLIYCREEIVKNTFPVNPENIKALIGDYKRLFKDLGTNARTMEGLRSMAQLNAFYLDEKDTAIAVLESAIKIGGNERDFRDKCKLDLGDIYILKNEPWEASLLYSQVEKSQKEEIMGHEAKLRNAKLHYFNGEFELSREILNVLKKATTREISNDAIQLSLLIEDNTGLDTSETAMQSYSAIELLLFQNKNKQALDSLQTLFVKYKSHSLADEILWLRANTYLKINQSEKALEDFENIMKNYSTDILADDATFGAAKIYEEKLGQKEKAMGLYQEILQKHAGSIFAAEARKRYRKLRGDLIN